MTKQVSAVLWLALAVPFLTTPLLAHHSFGAEYDSTKPVTLTGVVTKIEWTNPHSYIYLDVTDESGKVINWACEGAAPGALSRRGFQKGDIKYGDTLIIDGYRARPARGFSP